VQNSFQTSKLYDRNGALLYESLTPLAATANGQIQRNIALFALCDGCQRRSRFYDNQSIDIRGTARALVNNLQGGQTQVLLTSRSSW